MDNRYLYRPTAYERDRSQTMYQPIVVEVLTVDYEAKALTVKDLTTGTPYYGIRKFPANQSSFEGTDVAMPSVGSQGLAFHIEQQAGFSELAITNWIVSDTNRAQQVIATRAMDIPDMQGYNIRTRGSYRKAYPGQNTKTTPEGYSEKQDDGWDRLSADFSRDKLDPLARSWTRISSRTIDYTDAGLGMHGPVIRPGATGVPGDLLPDGTTLATVYLAPGSTATDRYNLGQQDITALVEHTTKVQEYALDYPVPAEALQSPLLTQVLGVTADPWARSVVSTTGGVAHDDQTFMVSQTWDHPTYTGTKAVGPTLNEGPTPRRRGFILERSEGTLVGSNAFDASTYGQPLKPVLFPYTALGRFAADVESAYLPANSSPDHVDTRVATSALSVRFPHEGNTTRWDVTKEGFTSFEIGSTLPKENIPLAGGYEHPHGAGRSLEGHLVGSLKLVVGKNRDEEDAIDLQALGQSVIRLGADDSALPNFNRSVMTQVRGSSDAVQNRAVQYWTSPKLQPGDAVNLEAKVGAENISLRGAFDGGTVLRLGARNTASRRRHLMNGYQDGPGVTAWALNNPNRKDSRSAGRLTYGTGDSIYQFHDLTTAGQSKLNRLPYFWSGAPVTNMDAHGLSLDVHAVRDILIRAGTNPASGQSLLADLAGGVVAGIGKDFQGRSITATLDGGIEMTIGANAQGKGIRLEIQGDVDWTVQGNFHLSVGGDTTFESTTHQHIVKTDHVIKAQNIHEMALVRHSTESPDISNNNGLYSSSPES